MNPHRSVRFKDALFLNTLLSLFLYCYCGFVQKDMQKSKITDNNIVLYSSIYQRKRREHQTSRWISSVALLSCSRRKQADS